VLLTFTIPAPERCPATPRATTLAARLVETGAEAPMTTARWQRTKLWWSVLFAAGAVLHWTCVVQLAELLGLS
jgi:hypothetical protein